MGRLDSRAGPRARLAVNNLEDRCTPSAVVGDPNWVQSISVNDGASSWEGVTSIEIEFTRKLEVRPERAIHLMESQLGGLVWTEVSIPNVEMWTNQANHSVLRMIGPSAGDAIVVDGDYKIVLTPNRFNMSVQVGSFHGIDLGALGDDDGDDDGGWH